MGPPLIRRVEASDAVELDQDAGTDLCPAAEDGPIVALLNLGILAHIDAGKTSLTERFLYLAGARKELGSVDQGSTLTDSMDLERARHHHPGRGSIIRDRRYPGQPS